MPVRYYDATSISRDRFVSVIEGFFFLSQEAWIENKKNSRSRHIQKIMFIREELGSQSNFRVIRVLSNDTFTQDLLLFKGEF